MDKERFSTLLQDPSEVTNADIKALNEYRKKYPYFQSLYVVVAKALKDRQHPKTEAFIKKAAIYSANRAHLKEIIEGDFTFAQKEKRKKQETEQKPVVKPETEPKTNKDSKPEATEEPKKAEVKKDSQKASEPKSQKESQTQVEQKEKAEPKQKLEEKVKEKQKAETTKAEPEKPVSASTKKDATPQKTTNQKEAATPSNPVNSKIDQDLAEIEAAKRRIEALLSGQLDDKEEEKSQKPLSSKKRNQIEIIEKFIKNEPQIDRERMADIEGKVDLEDLADKSILKEDAFETETLAELMVKQGKLKRAEQIYKKLSLKFPEKSTYFASQIEKLK